MPLGKWSSVVSGAFGAVIIAALVFLLTNVDRVRHTSPLTIAAVSLVGGVAIGLIQWVIVSQGQRQLDHLTHRIDAIGRADRDAADVPFRAHPVLAPLDAAVERATTTLRKRVDQLIAQKRELDVQLRLSENQRRHGEAIINSITDAVMVTDAFNEVALANQSAARLLNFDLEHASRKPIDQVVNDHLLVKLIKDTREAGPAARGLRRHVEHRRATAGQPAIYDVSLTCVVNARESPTEPAGVVTILRDITQEREVSAMKSDFVSAVSHELRTPLSSIKAYMEMLVDGEAGDEQTRSEFYNIITAETVRLQRLIDNILNISRIESGVVKIQRENISLPGIIHDVIDVMQPQARAKQITLIEMKSPVFASVFADKDMIYQAILNLVSNAIKYTPNGGRASISLETDDAERVVRVIVSDTGVGIPVDEIPHIFDKFHRVAEHKKMAMGTGLGLNLVKQIIETVHGGKVSLTSEVGKGSTFTFTLPLAENL